MCFHGTIRLGEQATCERRLLFCYNKTKDAPLAHPSICNKLNIVLELVSDRNCKVAGLS